MSDDWQKGDLALCVRGHANDGRRSPNECSPLREVFAPSPGTTWKVLWTEVHHRDEWSDKTALYLGLAGQPSDVIFNSINFRKITPEEADAFDTETIALLNGKPAREMA